MHNLFYSILFSLVTSFCFCAKAGAQLIKIRMNNTSFIFMVNDNKQLDQNYFGNSFFDITNYLSFISSGNFAFHAGVIYYTREPGNEANFNSVKKFFQY